MKQNPTIYKLTNKIDFDDVSDKIKNSLTNNGKKFKEKNFKINEFTSKLIVVESDIQESEWSTFFPEEFTNELSLDYQMPSLVLLVNTIKGIYCVIGGSFYSYVIPFLDKSYGLNSYSRIMNPTKDKIITIKTRGVTGLRAGMQEQFKDNFRIMDYIKFGKIPTELKIKLCDETTSLYFDKFVNSKSPYIILSISNGFSINKKLTFEELGLLFDVLVYFEKKLKPNDFFSSYKEITDENRISRNLKPGLISKLFKERNNIINDEISNFDVCYPGKVDEFYSADFYKIKIKTEKGKYIEVGETNDKSEILKIILKHFQKENYDRNLNRFENYIHKTKIYSYKNKQNISKIKTGLIYHLETEIVFETLGTYIHIDAKWYQLRENFIDEMNNRCFEILNSNNLSNKILDEKWLMRSNSKPMKEGDYNNQFNKKDYLVLDELTNDSIELADILYVKGDTTYLCHVKYGFSTEMRVLSNQILSSARRLKNDLKDNEQPYLKSIYKMLQNRKKSDGYSEQQFLDLFNINKKKIVYIMAFTGQLKNKSVLNNIESYSSNIAKLSLIQCYTEMRTEYYDLQFEIIDNNECFK